MVEAADKNLEIHLIDEDGKGIAPIIKTKITIRRPSSGIETVNRLVIRLDGVRFPKYGTYSVKAAVDGHEIVDIPLSVSPPPPSS